MGSLIEPPAYPDSKRIAEPPTHAKRKGALR